MLMAVVALLFGISLSPFIVIAV